MYLLDWKNQRNCRDVNVRLKEIKWVIWEDCQLGCRMWRIKFWIMASYVLDYIVLRFESYSVTIRFI